MSFTIYLRTPSYAYQILNNEMPFGDEFEARNYFDSNELTDRIKRMNLGEDGTIFLIDTDNDRLISKRPFHILQNESKEEEKKEEEKESISLYSYVIEFKDIDNRSFYILFPNNTSEEEALHYFNSNSMTLQIESSLVGYNDGIIALKDYETEEIIAERPYFKPPPEGWPEDEEKEEEDEEKEEEDEENEENEEDENSNWEDDFYILVHKSQVVARGTKRKMKKLYYELKDYGFKLFKIVN